MEAKRAESETGSSIHRLQPGALPLQKEKAQRDRRSAAIALVVEDAWMFVVRLGEVTASRGRPLAAAEQNCSD